MSSARDCETLSNTNNLCYRETCHDAIDWTTATIIVMSDRGEDARPKETDKETVYKNWAGKFEKTPSNDVEFNENSDVNGPAPNFLISHFNSRLIHIDGIDRLTVHFVIIMMRAFNILFLFCLLVAICSGFQVAPPSYTDVIRKSARRSSIITTPSLVASLQLSNNPNDDEEQRVRVDLVEDVDSFTLTAIGFSLIAFNFLVLANMGDAGLGGLVARFINFWNS